MVRASSLQALNTLSVNREIDSKYDAVLAVRDKLTEIELVAGIDVEALLTELQDAQDFTGITVVAGDHTSWDPINKIITVESVKGDTGAQGIQGPQGPQGLSIIGPKGDQGPTGAKGDIGAQGPRGFTGDTGPVGPAGIDGENLTVEQISYNGDGSFTWQFSDGTSYITPNLRGPKGDAGAQGVKGDTGLGVHHVKGTSTTNPNGDFGTATFKDTYTLYGDASETINLGHFTVANGVSDGMSMEVYDTNGNGIVDNSERLGNELPEYYVNVETNQSVGGNKVFAGNVTVQGDLTVNGAGTIVNAETVEVKDNTLLINKGETGHGVTAGVAGIVVDRGTATDYEFVWEETSQSFKIGEIGGLQKVATREDTPINGGVAVWNATDSRMDTTANPSVNSITIGGSAVSWNADESTLDVVLNGATLQVGQEQLIRVRNNSGVSITNGMAVMATGTVGNSGRITVAKANLTQANAKYILGVVTETIGVGADGFCTTFGKVRGIQTNGAQYGETWIDGDVLYVKDSGSGALTNVVPTDTQVKLPVAIVVNSHATNGTLFIRVNSIDENHAKVELATKVAKNASITAATHTKITYDSKGLVTSGTDLVAGDIPSLDASKITSGTLTVGTSGNAGTATKLQTARTINGVSFDGTANINVNTVAAEVIKFDTGTTEGTDLYTFNGSTAKTIDIKAGTNVTLTKSAGSVTISANDTAVGVTEITGMGTGASTFLATPSSANLAAMLTDETGTGAVVFANSPTFTGTPLAPTATVGTNTTQLATTAYVVAEINKIEEW